MWPVNLSINIHLSWRLDQSAGTSLHALVTIMEICYLLWERSQALGAILPVGQNILVDWRQLHIPLCRPMQSDTDSTSLCHSTIFIPRSSNVPRVNLRLLYWVWLFIMTITLPSASIVRHENCGQKLLGKKRALKFLIDPIHSSFVHLCSSVQTNDAL